MSAISDQFDVRPYSALMHLSAKALLCLGPPTLALEGRTAPAGPQAAMVYGVKMPAPAAISQKSFEKIQGTASRR
jgi:hypothetical protein